VRHNPAVQYVQKAMVSGQYGRVISINAKRVSSFPGRIHDVGVVVDLAIHDIDVIRYVTRGKVEAVFASGGSQMGRKHEDFANIMLMLEGGIIGVIETNWLTPVKIRLLKLTCSRSSPKRSGGELRDKAARRSGRPGRRSTSRPIISGRRLMLRVPRGGRRLGEDGADRRRAVGGIDIAGSGPDQFISDTAGIRSQARDFEEAGAAEE
jgi:predicted dehydrogenase